VIERMHIAELKFQSGSEGKSEAFGNPIRRRRNFDLIFLIDEKPGAKFDQAKFITQLDAEIVKLISASGLRMDGRSSSNDSFQLDYSQGEYRGSLDVACTRAEGNQLKLWAVIRELTREEKR